MDSLMRRTGRMLCALAKSALFPAAGIALGGLAAIAVLGHLRGLSPHAVLLAEAPDRLYVGLDCPYSRRALELLAEAPGEREIAVIPVELGATPEHERLCEQAAARVRRDQNFWWRLLPRDEICARLIDESRAWLTDQNGDETRIPVWIVDGAPIEPGLSAQVVADLRAAGLLADAAGAMSEPDSPSSM